MGSGALLAVTVPNEGAVEIEVPDGVIAGQEFSVSIPALQARRYPTQDRRGEAPARLREESARAAALAEAHAQIRAATHIQSVHRANTVRSEYERQRQVTQTEKTNATIKNLCQRNDLGFPTEETVRLLLIEAENSIPDLVKLLRARTSEMRANERTPATTPMSRGTEHTAPTAPLEYEQVAWRCVWCDEESSAEHFEGPTGVKELCTACAASFNARRGAVASKK
jgi:hypothetical protein